MTDTQPIGQSNVLKAIASVMAEVGSVAKAGTNKFHDYKYATAADVLHKLQPLMAKHGLTIVQHQRSMSFIQDGAAMAVEYEFHVLHSSGDKLDLAAVHTGVAAAKTSKGSPDDKAANKCHTAARKYFLLSLFQIPTGDYDDADADGDVPEPKPTPKTEKAAVAAAEKQKPTDGLCLETDNGPTYHATVSAYLDAFESGLSAAEDQNAFFDRNVEVLQAQQAKAAKAKGNKQAEAIVGRIKAIFDHIHAGTVPGLAAE